MLDSARTRAEELFWPFKPSNNADFVTQIQ
jgi:hypothetical protein